EPGGEQRRGWFGVGLDERKRRLLGGLDRQWSGERFGRGDDEEAHHAETERRGSEVGGCETGSAGDGRIGVVADGFEGRAAAAEVGGDGWVALVVDREAEVEGSGGLAEFGLADGFEKLCAVAEKELWRGDGVPENVAEAAESGCVGSDAVPVGFEPVLVGSADAFQTGSVRRDRAGVEGVEVERCAGCER